jgi:acetolactate synthase-1/2/3 large subunit
MSKEWVAHCLSEALAGRPPATVVSELGVPMAPMRLAGPRSFIQAPLAGGLGWGFPAALGIQLAEPDRLVVATMGDGSYIFSNPTACHQLAEALQLPVLVLILNNGEWVAVRRAVGAMYPGGAATTANRMPFTSLAPNPDFTAVATASRCRAERIERGEDLPAALERALRSIETERRPALIDIAIAV